MWELMNSKISVCKLPATEELVIFRNPLKRITAKSTDEILPALAEIQQLCNDYYAVGYISYEASKAFDSALKVKNGDWNLLDFYIYDSKPQPFEISNVKVNLTEAVQPELSEQNYLNDLQKVLNYIYDGDIYQANYTFRANLPKIDHPFELFQQLQRKHPVPYASFLQFDKKSIISISPELFLEKSGSHLFSKPMKGTAPRKPSFGEDQSQRTFLQNDPKNRAENLMIVDMVRNDFGRICQPGTVKVDPLFHVDTYETVHQMISTVHGQTDADLIEIFKALFPAASITGAPKVRAMEIIDELESSPREVYCGAVGCIVPGGDFCFNVPIRTILCENDKSRLGIGSGVVADSNPQSEWQESLLKSSFIFHHRPDFEVFETLAWFPETGYTDLDDHLERMQKSQNWFRRPFPEKPKQFLPQSFDSAQRIKLIIDKQGEIRVESVGLSQIGWGKEMIKLKISDKTVDSNDPFLYHKTTNRDFYNNEFKIAKAEGFDELIFFNENGNLTEGAISNIFVKIDNSWKTPALSCGILPGIERAKLLEKTKAKATDITLADLKSADEILICNSLRGSVKAQIQL